jgi:hypothetical protein
MKHRKLVLSAVSIAAFSLSATTVFAQPVPPSCGKRTEIVDALGKQFNERPVAQGLVNSNAIIEVFVSDGGSWTIIATGTDGRSCVVSAGEGWESSTILARLQAI